MVGSLHCPYACKGCIACACDGIQNSCKSVAAHKKSSLEPLKRQSANILGSTAADAPLRGAIQEIQVWGVLSLFCFDSGQSIQNAPQYHSNVGGRVCGNRTLPAFGR